MKIITRPDIVQILDGLNIPDEHKALVLAKVDEVAVSFSMDLFEPAPRSYGGAETEPSTNLAEYPL